MEGGNLFFRVDRRGKLRDVSSSVSSFEIRALARGETRHRGNLQMHLSSPPGLLLSLVLLILQDATQTPHLLPMLSAAHPDAIVTSSCECAWGLALAVESVLPRAALPAPGTSPMPLSRDPAVPTNSQRDCFLGWVTPRCAWTVAPLQRLSLRTCPLLLSFPRLCSHIPIGITSKTDCSFSSPGLRSLLSAC